MASTPARLALRNLLNRRKLIIAPGVFDGFSAHLTKRLGFTAAYMTGAGVAASGFGLPDIGLVTSTEMAQRASMIASVLGDIPLIADADTGYGAPINVVRTIRAYEAAGVAAIQLEDQVFPKRCGHLPNKQVVEPAEFLRTLTAALGSRNDEHLLVIARTDARAPLGLDAAIERANMYAAAGADIIFVEAPQSVDEIARIAAEVDAPLLINVVPGGLTPQQSTAQLQQLGYAIAIHPGAALHGAVAGMISGLSPLNNSAGTQLATSSPQEIFDLVGLNEWLAIDNTYAAKDSASWA